METKEVTTKDQNPIKALFSRPEVKMKIAEMLGKRETAFTTSVLSVVMNNDYLKKARPDSVYMSAMMAATLDLPINPNLGFAYLIPYNDRELGQVCQFQMGYKGFIQLGLRTGQFKTISATEIYEGQLIAENPLTGFVFDFSKKTSDKIIGYASYFSLINGFEKTFYMPKEKAEAHGAKYSKTYTNPKSRWKLDFDGMALKTVLKLLLSKYAPLSVEMQKAILADQGIIKDTETMDVDYVDEGNAKDAEVSLEDLQELFALKRDVMDAKGITEAERIVNGNEVNSFKKLNEKLKKL